LKVQALMKTKGLHHRQSQAEAAVASLLLTEDLVAGTSGAQCHPPQTEEAGRRFAQVRRSSLLQSICKRCFRAKVREL